MVTCYINGLGLEMELDFLPTTVMVAIVLFIIKEIVELIRRILADKRKLSAIKKLLAAEIEQNNWVIKSLKSDLNSIVNNWNVYDFQIVKQDTGCWLLQNYKDGSLGGGSFFYEPSNIMFNKLLLEIATLDPKLFKLCESAYEGVAEIKHICSSLIKHVTDQDEPRDEGFMRAFGEYALEELETSLESISTLYQSCTGTNLSNHRLRAYT
jgi:hypothetical protein